MTTGTKRGRGRPAYEPDDETRAKVTLWIAGGIQAPEIAHLLGITPPTVRKVFAAELKTRGAESKAKLLDAMWTNAMNGNASAQGKLLTHFESADAASNPKKAEKRGKKEERQAQAERKTSAGRFAVPQGPRLVTSNA